MNKLLNIKTVIYIGLFFYSNILSGQSFGVLFDFEPFKGSLVNGTFERDQNNQNIFSIYENHRSNLQGNFVIYHKRPNGLEFGIGLGYLRDEIDIQIKMNNTNDLSTGIYSNIFDLKQVGLNLHFAKHIDKFCFSFKLGAFKNISWNAKQQISHDYFLLPYGYSLKYKFPTSSVNTTFGVLSVNYRVTEKFSMGLNLYRRWRVIYDPISHPESYMDMTLIVVDEADGGGFDKVGRYFFTADRLSTTLSLVYTFDFYSRD